MTLTRIRMAAVLAAGTLPWLATMPAAHAVGDGVAVNGTYVAVSDGQWAQTNYSYHDEATVTSTWTVTSSCTTFQDCTGTVVSDAGWSADLRYTSGHWRVKHTIENWQTCPDGSTAPGEQSYEFWPVRADADLDHLVGLDRTTGPSGACGVNRWLNIQMPLTLTRIT